MVPYLAFTLVCGLPILFVEMAAGQRFQSGPSKLWGQISPYLGGLGMTGVLGGFMVGLYYKCAHPILGTLLTLVAIPLGLHLRAA